MGRTPRIYIKGGLYFISTASSPNKKLFIDDVDCAKYMELLLKYKEQYGFRLFSYALIPKKVHLLIEPTSGGTISEIMHVITSTYTKYFNDRYGKKGRLFQGRFSATLAERSSYLAELTGYIHQVPVMAGLSDKAEAYRWSSYQLYIGPEKDLLGMAGERDEVLKGYSPEHNEQARLYKEAVEAMGGDRLNELRKKLDALQIVGSKAFTKSIEESIKEGEKKEDEEKKIVWLESGQHKTFLIVGAALVLILSLYTFYLYRVNLGLVRNYEQALGEREDEFIKRLRSQQEKLKQDLSEKYRADMISYQVMQRRLKMEQEKVREAEERLEEQKRKREAEE